MARRQYLSEAQLQKEISELLDSIEDERKRKKDNIEESEFEESGTSEDVSSSDENSILETSTTLPKIKTVDNQEITVSKSPNVSVSGDTGGNIDFHLSDEEPCGSGYMPPAKKCRPRIRGGKKRF